VVNSCTVTARTDAETRRLIRRARRLNPAARIVATGCYAQVSPAELSRMPEVDVVLGNREKLDAGLLTDAAEDRIGDVDEGGERALLRLSSFAEHTRAFLQVQNGCDSFCSYCIVPFARGRSRSVPPQEVLDGVRRLVDGGFREIVLTGIHLGAYGLDISSGESLERLVRRILEETPLQRLRIGSLDPNEFGNDMISLFSRSPRICHHFHIPLQSGCDSVLTRMGRPYDSAFFRDLLERVIAAMPDAFIGSDIIAGFPGETDQEFETTCALVEELPLADLHVFPYSLRPRTEAAAMTGHLPSSVIHDRAARLRAIAGRKKELFLERAVGREIMVLGQQWDQSVGTVRGVSRNYIQAEFPGAPVDINVEQVVTVVGIQEGRALCRRHCPENDG
jgi:threonylcarbamoyladenosine tRNA methylthiotransferase MtaB